MYYFSLFNFEYNFLILGQILENNYFLIIIYICLLSYLQVKGNIENNYLYADNYSYLHKDNYLKKFFQIIFSILEYIFFYILLYFPFINLFRWNNYYLNNMILKFRYSLRINYIIYKYDFIDTDNDKNGNLKFFFDYLFKKWLLNFSYIISIYVIYIKIILRLFYYFIILLFYFIYNFIIILLSYNLLFLYIYDFLRYLNYQLQILVFKRLNKNIINKFWLLLDYLKIEFVYLTYNIPYSFIISIIITFFNFIYIRLFSFYNYYKFEKKDNDNIIPYTLSLRFFSFLNDYLIATKLRINFLTFINQFKIIIKIIFINFKLIILSNLNILPNKVLNFKINFNILKFILKFNTLFLFVGLINILICKIIYKTINILIYLLYNIFCKLYYIIYILLLIIILYYWFDLINLITNLKINMIIIKPLIFIINIINYNIYYNEIWVWFYNYNFNNNLFNNQIILFSFKKFILSLEMQKSNYFLLFLDNLKSLKLIFYSILEINFYYFLELLYYWYYQFNFNFFIYLKILIYYFSYYIYLYIYIWITPFLFLNKYLYAYYFWQGYIYLSLLYKSIIYYFFKLYFYILPYYFYSKILNIYFFFFGIYFKYKILFNYLYLNNIFLMLILISKLVYISIKKIIFINIIFFIDIYTNFDIFFNIYIYSLVIIANSYIKISKIINNLLFYINYIHINLLIETQSIIDLILSNNRLSKFNYNKFTVTLADNFYLYKTRILGLKILSPITGEIIDYYKTFRPIFFFRQDSLSFINNNFYIKIIIYLKKDFFNIYNLIMVNDLFPIIFYYLKYYFLQIYIIIYLIFKYIIIYNNNYEFNLSYSWNKIIKNKLVTVNHYNYINSGSKLKIIKLNLFNLVTGKYNKYIINQNHNKSKSYLINLSNKNIKVRSQYLLLNNKLNFDYILNNIFNKALNELQKNYKKDKYVYSFCNLQNCIYEEEYYYNNITDKSYSKDLEKIHKKITNNIITYFNFLENILFNMNGPNWLLNKSYSTLFFNKNLGNEVILMPYTFAANEGFFWCLFLPLLYYYFIFFISCNFYNMLEIQEFFFYNYFYIFLENIEIIYNFYMTFISINTFIDYEFNFYSLSKKSMDEEFMFFFSEKIKYYFYSKKYNNLNFLFNYIYDDWFYLYNSNYIIYSFKILKIYFFRFIILLFLFLYIIYKNKNNKIINLKKYNYNKFIISILYHYKFIINKKFKFFIYI